MTTYKVGDQVFDGASEKLCSILEVSADDETGRPVYLLDAPTDPTRDGAFPDGWRGPREIFTNADDPRRAEFTY